MLSKYQLMDSSIVTDEHGNNYPDLATFPLNEMRITQKPSDYKLTQNDLCKFFNLTYEYYGNFNFYDNIILWLNDINDIASDENFEKNIKLYGKNDIDSWYKENIKL